MQILALGNAKINQHVGIFSLGDAKVWRWGSIYRLISLVFPARRYLRALLVFLLIVTLNLLMLGLNVGIAFLITNIAQVRKELKILPSSDRTATWSIMVNVSTWCLPTTAHKEWCARYYYRNDKESYTFQQQNPFILQHDVHTNIP